MAAIRQPREAVNLRLALLEGHLLWPRDERAVPSRIDAAGKLPAQPRLRVVPSLVRLPDYGVVVLLPKLDVLLPLHRVDREIRPVQVPAEMPARDDAVMEVAEVCILEPQIHLRRLAACRVPHGGRERPVDGRDLVPVSIRRRVQENLPRA